MNAELPILAEGIPTGLIFFVIVAILLGLTAIFGKSTPGDAAARASDRGRRQNELDALRRRMSDAAGIAAAPVRRTSTSAESRPKKQNRSRLQQAAAAMAKEEAARAAADRARRAAAEVKATATAATAEPMQVATRALASAETARNVRLLLQPSSLRESFVLSEVFGKPKSLQ